MKGIARHLRHHGATLVTDPMSFLVTKDNHLEADEEAHARSWGEEIGQSFAGLPVTTDSA